MEYQKFNRTIIARLDRGEEILEQLRILSAKEGIRLASVSGLGATDDFTVGVFLTESKEYKANTFHGAHEIVSLTGTINTMNGEHYSHLHMSAGNESGQVVGGHLNRAVISATCELVIQTLEGEIDREFNPEIGLNLYRFAR